LIYVAKSSRSFFFPEYCLKINFFIYLYFFFYLTILIKATFVTKGKSVTLLPVWGQEDKLVEEAAATQASPNRLQNIIFRTSSTAVPMRGQSQHGRIYWHDQGEGAYGACAVHKVVA